ncbi:MAG: replication initiator protein A [Pseudorhizobium sp.]
MNKRASGPQAIGDLAANVLQNTRQTGNTHDLDAALDRFDQVRAQRKAETLRKPPEGDEQPDFFVPALFDVATKDNRSIMDVAVFRLSKKDKRVGQVIRYDLPDGYVEVKSGADGMASVWDYDIVLMMISYLTEGTNRHKAGRGELPAREFRPHVSEILKFCRRSDGGKQYAAIEEALGRLKTTTLKIVRTEKGRGGRTVRRVREQGLIENYEVVSYADNGQVQSVIITAPDWLYREVTEGKNPNVLTVHPDYFLIEPGIGRFVYRLARRAAGRSEARWAFQTIYERSGSAGTFKEFCRILRKIIQADDLPEYSLREEAGQGGPQLAMTYRNQLSAPAEEAGV